MMPTATPAQESKSEQFQSEQSQFEQTQSEQTQSERSQTQYVPFSNDDIATMLEQVADLLEIKEDDYYRIRAYREAAQTIGALKQSLIEIWQAEGTQGLAKLPHIGARLSRSLEELIHSGELRVLNQLLTHLSPGQVFMTIPGIGEVLAQRLHKDLGLETLEDLEVAAHTGRLDTVEGFGKGRIRLIRDELETMLNRSSRQRVQRNRWRETHPPTLDAPQPPRALILEIDAQYRHLAAAGQLPMITPRRFNIEGKRWLPIMYLQRGEWQFSALYSNTARAHKLGKVYDWVIIHCERDGHQGHYTVVTETRGALRGQRVVRG